MANEEVTSAESIPLGQEEMVIYAKSPEGDLNNTESRDRFAQYMAENYPDRVGGRTYESALDVAYEQDLDPTNVYMGMAQGDMETEVEIAKRSGYSLPIDMERVTSLDTGDKRSRIHGMYLPEVVGDRSFVEVRGGGRSLPDFFPAEQQMAAIYQSMAEYEKAFGDSPTPDISSNPEMFTEGDQIFTIGPGGMDPQTMAHEFYHRSGIREEKPIYTMEIINAQTPLEYKKALITYASRYRGDLLKDPETDKISIPTQLAYAKLTRGEDAELPSGLEKNVLLDVTERPYKSGGLDANKSIPSQMVFEEFAQGKRGPRNEDTQDTVMGGIADFFDLKDTPTKVELLDDLYKMRVTDSIFGKRRSELLTEPSLKNAMGLGEFVSDPDYGYDTDYFMKDSTANPENLTFNKLMRTAEPRTLINRDYAEHLPDIVEYQRNIPQITEEELIERFLDLRASEKTGYTGDRQSLIKQGLKSRLAEQKLASEQLAETVVDTGNK
jgi:hypothetical protein